MSLQKKIFSIMQSNACHSLMDITHCIIIHFSRETNGFLLMVNRYISFCICMQIINAKFCFRLSFSKYNLFPLLLQKCKFDVNYWIQLKYQDLFHLLEQVLAMKMKVSTCTDFKILKFFRNKIYGNFYHIFYI